MKKYLLIILLSIICIIPFSVNAEVENPNFYLYPNPMTNEQKEIFLDFIYNDSAFISAKEQYSYYMIVFSDNNSKVAFNSGYSFPMIYVYFSNSIPTIYDNFGRRFLISTSTMDRGSAISYEAHLDTNYIAIWSSSQQKRDPFLLNDDYFTKLSDSGLTLYGFYRDYYLDINFEITLSWDLNLYDLDGNLIKTYPAGTDIFYKSEPVEPEKEYTIEDILNSDDVLYSLSKDLIGSLPEEFQFIYSIVALMIGLIIVLVIISPFILLIRWLM